MNGTLIALLTCPACKEVQLTLSKERAEEGWIAWEACEHMIHRRYSHEDYSPPPRNTENLVEKGGSGGRDGKDIHDTGSDLLGKAENTWEKGTRWSEEEMGMEKV